MQNDTNLTKKLILDTVNFGLNTVKNSQFINLIIATIIYCSIFMIILLGFSFTFFEEQTSSIIVNIAKYTDYTNYNIYFSMLIKYYLLIILILGIFQEFILISIYKIFKKDFRNQLIKSKRVLFFSIVTVILIIEIILSIILKEYWLSSIGFISFACLFFFYMLHRYIFEFINKIQNHVNKLY